MAGMEQKEIGGKIMNRVDRVIAYEQGELGEAETIKLFQELIDSGLAWILQGHYGRTAQALIEAGLCQSTLRLEGEPRLD